MLKGKKFDAFTLKLFKNKFITNRKQLVCYSSKKTGL